MKYLSLLRQRSLLLAALIAAILAVHAWSLSTVPRGLYQDETAIGYNALLIAEEGRDEHGERLPLYFRSFGDYKSPVYIYSAALLFALSDSPSAGVLRLTSTVYFAVLLLSVTGIAHLLWRRWPVTIYAALATGFVPWYFTISRLAFEVIS